MSYAIDCYRLDFKQQCCLGHQKRFTGFAEKEKGIWQKAILTGQWKRETS